MKIDSDASVDSSQKLEALHSLVCMPRVPRSLRAPAEREKEKTTRENQTRSSPSLDETNLPFSSQSLFRIFLPRSYPVDLPSIRRKSAAFLSPSLRSTREQGGEERGSKLELFDLVLSSNLLPPLLLLLLLFHPFCQSVRLLSPLLHSSYSDTDLSSSFFQQ